MLRILGSPRRLCDGVRRRDFLKAGSLAAGLSLPQLYHSHANASDATSPGFGSAKSCILLYLYGSPSQLETFDVKPDAPIEIRGELGTIPTVLPGYHIGELLPRTAEVLDRCTIVRSMTHPYPVHGIAYATTGLEDPTGSIELSARDPKHWPFLGSVIEYHDQQLSPGSSPEIPRNLGLPFPLSSRRSDQPPRSGPYGGFFGPSYDPIWTEFQGTATRGFVQENRGVVREIFDPYIGIDSNCSFRMSSDGQLREELTLDRLDRRRSLLDQFDEVRRTSDSQQLASLDRHQQTAFGLLTSTKMQEALDITRESMSLRDDYGMSLFGQGALVSRRLIEAGGRLVSLFWDEFGLTDSAWDTHYQHYRRMREELCPSFDQGYSALIRDLDERGLLDETLVVCISEHGRTPKLDNVTGAGRGHWSRAYSAIFAGAGFGRGQVIGATDAIAGDVVETPVSPKDILATVYHLLGIDPDSTIPDRQGRPHRIAGSGVVRDELLA